MVDIRPEQPNKWKITSIDKPTNKEVSNVYDAVMICNGHYNDPAIPKLRAIELFKGVQTHSHHYRRPEPFTGKRVLVIGAGPSGLDIALHISSVAEKVSLLSTCVS